MQALQKKLPGLLILAGLIAAGVVCQPANGHAPDSERLSKDAEFREYWYNGTAELNRYQLEQARYGELHAGEAVLIFVTEAFLKSKQVKYEGPYDGPGASNALDIFKINATRKFFTGIYPYSTMTSTFTPVDDGPARRKALKITTSVQEWCGHVYAQLNLRGDEYRVRSHSYFEREADQNFAIKDSITEDGLWALIRLNPEALPRGRVELLPGTQFLRLRHLPTRSESATIELRDLDVSKNAADASLRVGAAALQVYEIQYANIPRTLRIAFEKDFPHGIVAWEEVGESGWGPSKKTLTTRARRTNIMRTDYWARHLNRDAPLRAKLGVTSK
ncbi:MAG: hypothetical protein NXI24_13330 [bacterium]|nr:hypothetical protein [bacterium]